MCTKPCHDVHRIESVSHLFQTPYFFFIFAEFWILPEFRTKKKKPLGEFLSKLKNRKEFEGGLEKGKRKGGQEEKKKRVIKHTLKYLSEA